MQKISPVDLLENNFSVSKEFIDGCKLGRTGPKKNGGPYSVSDKQLRRNEVYRLHFDYGYSGRKIADVMKVNRKTIDNDVSYLYSRVLEKWGHPDPEYWLVMSMENLEVQRSRVREEIDKSSNTQVRISAERLLLEIESKRADIELKLCNSIERTHRRSVDLANTWLKKEQRKTRYVSFWDTFRTTQKGSEQIKSILKREKPFQGK